MRKLGPPTCHPDRSYHGNGLCSPCYNRKWADDHRTHLNAYGRMFYAKNGRKTDTEGDRRRRLARRYGVTRGEYADILKEQQSVCAIGVDRNHITGLIRGLVCHDCNLTLGHIDQVGLDNFQAYLAERDW